MRKKIITLTLILVTVPAMASAITQHDAQQRFGHYLRGRCGERYGPFVFWTCKWLVNHGCRRVGNQIDRPQWFCAGAVGQKRGGWNFFARGDQECAVAAYYAPNGKRLRGSKLCHLVLYATRDKP